MGKLSAELEKELRGVIEKPFRLPENFDEAKEIMNFNVRFCYLAAPYFDAFDALAQLIVIRDAYWKAAGDWRPNWNNPYQEKHAIFFYGEDVDKGECHSHHLILSFPTEEQRNHFAEHHIDLINQAKPLL